MTELTRPSSRDWLLLPAAVALALLWRAVFPLYQLVELAFGEGCPALGITAVTAAIWAAVLLFLGKSARWNAYSIFLAAGALLLALCCAVYLAVTPADWVRPGQWEAVRRLLLGR